MGARNVARLLSGENVTLLKSTTLNTAALNVTGNTAVSGAVALTAAMTISGSGRVVGKVTDLTANTTLSATHYGGIITNRGASGAIVVTLPDAAAAGESVLYLGVANQNVTFKSATVDKLIILGDAAADSLAFSTASEKIGAAGLFVSDGTLWHAIPIVGTATTAT